MVLHDRANQILVSAGTAYEIEFKRQRSADIQELPADLQAGVAELGFEWLPILPQHALLAGKLPRLHGDPFDRLIVAQALIEQLNLISCDGLLAPYGAPVIW
ncbi:MAG TPA: type II toxin-antitoxin system VapC family toxin [Caulobacteraceae bacterium]